MDNGLLLVSLVHAHRPVAPGPRLAIQKARPRRWQWVRFLFRRTPKPCPVQ